ncbi:hypothetical protein BH10CYA1_BH10CYA1_57170 [soil metagenome]
MLKKLASSFILASALVGTLVAPSLADDDTFKSVVVFPMRVVGTGVGMVVGAPLGAFKDSVKGSIKASKAVSGKLGNEDNGGCQFFGSILGGPFGFVGGGAYGMFDGAVHGAKEGYEKPFSKDTFTFKDE